MPAMVSRRGPGPPCRLRAAVASVILPRSRRSVVESPLVWANRLRGRRDTFTLTHTMTEPHRVNRRRLAYAAVLVALAILPNVLHVYGAVMYIPATKGGVVYLPTPD